MPLLWLFSLKFLITLTIFWYLCQSLSHHHITQSICFVINIISFRRLIGGLRYVIYVSWEYWTYQCFGSVSFTLLSDRWSCWSPGPGNTIASLQHYDKSAASAVQSATTIASQSCCQSGTGTVETGVVIGSYFRLPRINLAAALSTDWSRSSMYVGVPDHSTAPGPALAEHPGTH